MFTSSSNKLLDQIFELKFTSKQLVKESRRCEAAERAEKGRAKSAMEKGNMEGAAVYAQNAIRKRSEALNYLQLASRLDAVVSRLDAQAKMSAVNRGMVGIVRSLGAALRDAPLDRMVATMGAFEKQFEDLDVQTGVMNDKMGAQAALSTPPEQVNELLHRIADEHGLDVRFALPAPGAAAVAAPPAGERDDLAARLEELRRAA
jgi:charged multivesicular body protein 1